ncbi:MAG: CdaR family protein [Defluviitaleaceae bacterium]|nr:CdaR family protein [Defluviitaleaceae bacterium]
MTALKNFFSMLFEDLHWKLLALLAASVIWFIGMHMNDPYQSQTVSPRLQLDNLEIMTREGIIVLNEDALRDLNVSVLVRALRSDMDYLRSAMADAERLSAFVNVSVDFRAVNSDLVSYAEGISTQLLRVSPNLQPGFEHISINPPYIDIYLDMSQRQLFSVQTIQQGDVPPGFELQYIRLRNENVTINGPRTELQMVSQVQAIVDITGVHDDAELTIPLQVLDIYGNYMTDRVQLNVVETTATIHVLQIRTADIRLRGEGSPAEGFAVAGISGGISTVEIVGSEEILDELDQIVIDVELHSASSNITRTVYISDFLPEGVNLRQGEYDEIEVTARIEPIEERVFIVPHENLRSRGVVGLYRLVDENEPIRVTISGPRSLIAAMEADQIEPEFDLRRLPIGVHTVPLLIELPSGMSIIGSAPTLLVQIHEPALSNGDEDESEFPTIDESSTFEEEPPDIYETDESEEE